MDVVVSMFEVAMDAGDWVSFGLALGNCSSSSLIRVLIESTSRGPVSSTTALVGPEDSNLEDPLWVTRSLSVFEAVFADSDTGVGPH